VLYPEGTRSRDGALGPFLPAAARYLRGAAWVVPVVVRGTDALFGRDERFRPQPVHVRIGEAFDPGAVVGDPKTAALEEARRRVLGVMAD
jgi:1-acyl-sn-glycerol-3-phosphate acyltransferase